MKKVLIIGIVASGKTTLAKRLSKKINIPYYELDCIVHTKHEVSNKRTKEEQHAMIAEIDKNGEWIFEGIFRESYIHLFDLSDTIILLQTPLWKRRLRVFVRYFKQIYGIESSHYLSDFKMLKNMYRWASDPGSKMAKIEALLTNYSFKVIRLTDNKDFSFIKMKT